jgi:threonine/homoserine/homoserine lactone efflux protein
MDIVAHIFYGSIMAYFGLISPGMLNMTALKIRISIGKTQSIQFAAGAALIVFFQAGIALFFADVLVQNPSIIETLKIIGIIVFFLLSYFFYKLSKKKTKTQQSVKAGNYFLKGVGLSSINMLAIPFYLGVSIFLASKEKITIQMPNIIYFIIGAALGSFLLFMSYIKFADIIVKRISFIAKNINIILSLLFFALGIFTFFRTFSN